MVDIGHYDLQDPWKLAVIDQIVKCFIARTKRSIN